MHTISELISCDYILNRVQIWTLTCHLYDFCAILHDIFSMHSQKSGYFVAEGVIRKDFWPPNAFFYRFVKFNLFKLTTPILIIAKNCKDYKNCSLFSQRFANFGSSD